MKVRVTMDTGVAGHVAPETLFPSMDLQHHRTPYSFVKATVERIRDSPSIKFRRGVVKRHLQEESCASRQRRVVLDESNPHVSDTRDGARQPSWMRTAVSTRRTCRRASMQQAQLFSWQGTVHGICAISKLKRPVTLCRSNEERKVSTTNCNCQKRE